MAATQNSDTSQVSSFTTQPPSNEPKTRPVSDLPQLYRRVFSSFTEFNKIQSRLFERLLYDDNTYVIASPTGSGKTVLLELAIIREMMKLENDEKEFNFDSWQPPNNHNFKGLHVLYLAPLKAIVEEKRSEWQTKFGPFGINCVSMTGDITEENYSTHQESAYMNINIMLATPEKFDHLIRSDPKSRGLLNILQLVMVDEIHVLCDKSRGDVLEATITRIKTIRKSKPLRFIAISATCSNVEDIADWMDHTNGTGISIGDHMRPVKLDKIVLGVEPNKSAAFSEYRFDMLLTYRLENLIRTHSNGKPTLVFCSTRKGVEFSAKTLSSSQQSFYESADQRTELFYQLNEMVNSNFDMYSGNTVDNECYFKNLDLKSCIASGVGFYHSGLEYSDRRLLEQLFSKSLIPVLVSTSSLAMGVNLPAHLVIVRNTMQYTAGSTEEYDLSTILQMIGRAGRPQFDTRATAIIMTRNDKKEKYQSILNSKQTIESSMHLTLTEQLTSEIVLKSITTIKSAIEWIQSTFLFIRITRNPSYYGSDIDADDFEGAIPYVSNWCEKAIDRLNSVGLIAKKENDSFEATHLARILIRHSVSLNVFSKLLKILTEPISLKELLERLCTCKDICQDVTLRVSEKRLLMELNKRIRFPYKDRFKTNFMKINCLLQSTFESLTIESALIQDCNTVLRLGQRVSKCLSEICVYLCTMHQLEKSTISLNITKLDIPFETIISALTLAKVFRAKMWHDSTHVAKQLSKIGNVFCSILVEKGLTTFQKLLDTNPRDIEFSLKRHPPFGSVLIEEIKSLPKYNLKLKLSQANSPFFEPEIQNFILSTAQVRLELNIMDIRNMCANQSVLLKPKSHYLVLLVGCEECDQLIYLHRFSDEMLQDIGIFSRDIILVQTKFKLDSIKEPDNTTNEYGRLFELSTQSANNKRKDAAPKKKPTKKQKTNNEPQPKVKRVDSEEYREFAIKLGVNNTDITKQHAYHCCYSNQKNHKIKAMVISESFVGLDVTKELDVAMNTRNTVYIGRQSTPPSRSVQSTLSASGSKLSFSRTSKLVKSSSATNSKNPSVQNSECTFPDDEEHDNYFLDDVGGKQLCQVDMINGIKPVDNEGMDFMSDIDSSDLEDLIPTQPNYSQFETNKEYGISSQATTPIRADKDNNDEDLFDSFGGIEERQLNQETEFDSPSSSPLPAIPQSLFASGSSKPIAEKMMEHQDKAKTNKPTNEEITQFTQSVMAKYGLKSLQPGPAAAAGNSSYATHPLNRDKQTRLMFNSSFASQAVINGDHEKDFTVDKAVSQGRVSKYFANKPRAASSRFNSSI